ncbi:MAG: hypothetical protein WD071_15905, partial [Pseudohongiella sp.]|uniref:hypothetical protein n=1 Tax=Pseudohongiella sp. TaxID=1979412 RepID=UPI00349FD5D8
MNASRLLLMVAIGTLLAIPSAQTAVLFQSGSIGVLETFDTVSGATALIGSSPVGTMDGLAFSPNGTLYGIHSSPMPSSDQGSLYTINIRTGEANLVGHTGLLAQGMTFGLDGTLYTMAGGN